MVLQVENLPVLIRNSHRYAQPSSPAVLGCHDAGRSWRKQDTAMVLQMEPSRFVFEFPQIGRGLFPAVLVCHDAGRSWRKQDTAMVLQVENLLVSFSNSHK